MLNILKIKEFSALFLAKARSLLLVWKDIMHVCGIAYILVIGKLLVNVLSVSDPVSFYLYSFMNYFSVTCCSIDSAFEQGANLILPDSLDTTRWVESATKTYQLLTYTWYGWANCSSIAERDSDIAWPWLEQCLGGVIALINFFSWTDWYYFISNTIQPLTPISFFYEVNKGFVYGADELSYSNYIRGGFKALLMANMPGSDLMVRIKATEFLAFMSTACSQPIYRIITI